jgi:hypothetical protein
MTQSSASPEQQADDSSDDNVDDNLAPPAPSLTGSRCRSRAGQRTCALLGAKGSQVGHHAGRGLPPRDRSSNRNEQHRATHVCSYPLAGASASAASRVRRAAARQNASSPAVTSSMMGTMSG